MISRCKFCGNEIKKREDRVRVTIMGPEVHIMGYCDDCLNWTVLKRVPMDKMKEYIKLKMNNDKN